MRGPIKGLLESVCIRLTAKVIFGRSVYLFELLCRNPFRDTEPFGKLSLTNVWYLVRLIDAFTANVYDAHLSRHISTRFRIGQSESGMSWSG